jgi:hypothetical protein
MYHEHGDTPVSFHILRNHLSGSYVTDRLLETAQRFDAFQNGSSVQRGIFKLLMKFSVIERLLPDHNKRTNLVRYYDRLKVKVSWQKNDPQYWVQYAMARMMYHELDKAETNLRRAYEIAERKHYYDTEYIDAQWARLKLTRSQEESDALAAFDLFKEAHSKLVPHANDLYKFRQVLAYENVFAKHFHNFPPRQKIEFEHACKKMLSDIREPVSELKATRGSSVVIECKDKLTRITHAIRQARSK